MNDTEVVSGVVYKITNIIDGKIYIGQTTQNIKRRFQQHCNARGKTLNNSYIAKAIKKYDKENFTIEVLEICENINILNERENFWIIELSSMSPSGYNLMGGGNNSGKRSDASRLKMSLSRIGKEPHNKGMPLKQEIKDKISKSLKGKVESCETKKRKSNSQQKRGPNKNKKSKYKGVYWKKCKKVWTVELKHMGKRFYVGQSKNEKEAALMYNKKAIELFGEGCYLNEVENDG